jgi:creatinine amidohydrolase
MVFSTSEEMLMQKYETSETQLVTHDWTEIRRLLEDSQTIICPIGAIEQHGPSCPLWTDTLLADAIAQEIGDRSGTLVAPSIPFGDSMLHLDFAGTISLRPSTLLLVVRDYVESLHGVGFRRFLFVNGHGDNRGTVLAALSELSSELPDIRYFVHDFWDFPDFRAAMESAFGDPIGGHADATDASLVLYLAPGLVKSDRFASNVPQTEAWISRNLVQALYTETGVINADQRLASPDVGKRLFECAVEGYLLLLSKLDG